MSKDEKRAEILDAAIRVFARTGFHATKIEDVAREARVAKGTIYLYFDRREDILDAAFVRFADGVLTQMRAIAKAREPALSRLRSIVEAMLAGAQSGPDLARLVFDFWAARRIGGSGERPGTPVDFAGIYVEYRQLIGSLLEQAKDEGAVRADVPEDTPAVIVGLVEGLLLQCLVDPGALTPSRMAEPALAVILDGLAPGAPH
ncbi:TetR/AcrR family transcriptional regulator [Actinocrispum wychmicini]|nr:TetR/AcrR family transcriptional regulator [Actinocrispum wychmicini]